MLACRGQQGRYSMVAETGEGHVLLIKKLGGVFLVILGCLLTAVGINLQSTGVIVLGVVLLVLGAILLALKIIRRNQGNAPP